jgi:hypothetical protein
VAVTDDQVAALRAYLSARADVEATDAERQFLTPVQNRPPGRGPEPWSARPSRPPRGAVLPHLDIPRDHLLRGRLPQQLPEAAELLSPSAAENQLREVLGDKQAIRPPVEARARA